MFITAEKHPEYQSQAELGPPTNSPIYTSTFHRRAAQLVKLSTVVHRSRTVVRFVVLNHEISVGNRYRRGPPRRDGNEGRSVRGIKSSRSVESPARRINPNLHFYSRKHPYRIAAERPAPCFSAQRLVF